MGKGMMAAYEEATRCGGIAARVKLAMLTKTGSAQAEALPDTPASLKVFAEAMEAIRSEFAGKFKPRQEEASGKREQMNKSYRDLMDRRSTLMVDPTSASREITEAATRALDVERASIWFYDQAKTLIRCIDLYSRRAREHSAGIELLAKDFAAYFKALETERTIAAHDAHTDPRTSAFSKPYLTPLGINSMLDVPIWREGKMLGVMCNEHTGPARHWTTDEEEFAYGVGSIVGLIGKPV